MDENEADPKERREKDEFFDGFSARKGGGSCRHGLIIADTGRPDYFFIRLLLRG